MYHINYKSYVRHNLKRIKFNSDNPTVLSHNFQ